MENCNIKLRAEISSKDQLDQVIKQADFDFVYAPIDLLDGGTPQKEKIIAVPNVFLADCQNNTQKKLVRLKEMGFERALAHTVGHIPLIQKAGMKLHGGMRLNITNSLSVGFFADSGFEDVILSCELTAKRIREISPRIPIGIIAYGRLPLMITRRCPINGGKPCQSGENCGGYLKDRKGEKILTLCSNTVELLNPDILTVANRLSDFDTCDFFVMRFTHEKNITEELDRFKKGEKPDGSVTAGLYYRGVD